MASINLGDRSDDIPPTKAERIVRWLDQCKRQEEAIREFMKPDANLLKAWLGGVAVR